MTKLPKTIIALGVASALSVAIVPIASGSAATTVSGSPVSEEVKYVVGGSLSLSIGVTSGAVDPSAATVITAGSSLATKGNDIKVTGNDNYKVTMKDADTNTSLTNGTGGSLATFSEAKTNLESDGWGITLGTAYGTNHSGDLVVGTYKPVPSSSGTALTIVQTSNTSASFSNDTTAVKYGIKTASSQPAGTYTDTIVFTLAGN